MNIIKRFARWVLREDLLNLDISIRSAERSLKEKNKELNDVQSKLNDWILRSKLNESSILPQSAVKSIIDCLPNPNDAAAGSYTLKKGKSVYFSHYVRGQKMNHLVRIEAFYELNKVIHAKVKIYDLNINISLPLRKEKIVYNMLGVNTEVETYYWDFNFSNIKIISDDVFDMISEFIVAQRNVLTEL